MAAVVADADADADGSEAKQTKQIKPKQTKADQSKEPFRLFRWRLQCLQPETRETAHPRKVGSWLEELGRGQVPSEAGAWNPEDGNVMELTLAVRSELHVHGGLAGSKRSERMRRLTCCGCSVGVGGAKM